MSDQGTVLNKSFMSMSGACGVKIYVQFSFMTISPSFLPLAVILFS